MATSQNDCIKVAIRVRPKLRGEIAQEDVVYVQEDRKSIQVTHDAHLV